MRRRAVVVGILALLGLSACGASGPERDLVVESYGSHRLQVGEWFLPEGGPHPVVVLLHGGCYQAVYDRHLEDEVALRLQAEGFAVWNVEYRPPSVSPYPATFEDVAAAIDFLPSSRFRERLDLDRVAFVGHSAGGQLALWAGSGSTSSPAPPSLRPQLVVAQSPLADLRWSARERVCGSAVPELLGGTPGEVPERYAAVDPALLPSLVTTVLLHGPGDRTVPVEESTRFVEALEGSPVRLVEVPGDHFAHLEPSSPAIDRLLEELAVLRH